MKSLTYLVFSNLGIWLIELDCVRTQQENLCKPRQDRKEGHDISRLKKKRLCKTLLLPTILP